MKEIIDKLDFIKIKSLCSVKDSYQENEKTSHRLQENNSKIYIWQSIII